MEYKVKLIKEDQEIIVNSGSIKEINQSFGDLVIFHDICGMGWIRCSNCQGQEVGCGERFETGRMRSEPDCIEVIFIDGRIDFFSNYELIRE